MSDSGEEIRAAFASGEFVKARQLWSIHAERLRAAILARHATAADMEEAGRLVEWARTVVKCFRARSQERIAEARAVARYSGATPSEYRIRALL